MDSSTLIWEMILGSIGGGYLIYATRQKKGMALISAIALFIVPYFIPNLYLMLAAGIVFMALPFFLRF